MEQRPQDNEQDYHRPPLEIDLSGPDGNVFNVISIASAHLTGHALEEFNQSIWQNTEVGSGKTYQDILQVVNTYLDLTDTSNLYPQYGAETHISTALDRLNVDLHLLPSGIESEVTGLYPDFSNPNFGPDRYGLLLEAEIRRVEAEVETAKENMAYDWLNLRSQLLACVAALHRAGVTW